ncbi:hypothetical protein KL86DYS1_20295 [uncultured Dysgonomonas sp.]|uniref:Uncharacterized protein n=1 Tax=uncultured Dysgonomonas sp. TaxID=206096 RepID=A0A212JN48_9BACT|nr:hypothetical protein KL86DYS1_20295 [uncultured Dysgonomonas sp.]
MKNYFNLVLDTETFLNKRIVIIINKLYLMEYRLVINSQQILI